MNKKLIIGSVVLLLLAGGAYAMKNKNSSLNAPRTANQTINEAQEFASAIESGKPTICTMTKGSDLMEYSIKGKKMRIKTTSNIQDDKGVAKTMIGHMINDEKFFYTWDETTKQGSKISLTVASPSPASKTQTAESAPELKSAEDYNALKNEGYIINCKSSIIDDAVFTPPSDVKFIDPTEFMKQVTSTQENGQIDMKKLEELQKQYGGE